MLECEAESPAEGLAHPGDGGALLGHFDEYLAGHTIVVEADGEVALVACDVELVGERPPGGGENLSIWTSGMRGHDVNHSVSALVMQCQRERAEPGVGIGPPTLLGAESWGGGLG